MRWDPTLSVIHHQAYEKTNQLSNSIQSFCNSQVNTRRPSKQSEWTSSWMTLADLDVQFRKSSDHDRFSRILEILSPLLEHYSSLGRWKWIFRKALFSSCVFDNPTTVVVPPHNILNQGRTWTVKLLSLLRESLSFIRLASWQLFRVRVTKRMLGSQISLCVLFEVTSIWIHLPRASLHLRVFAGVRIVSAHHISTARCVSSNENLWYCDSASHRNRSLDRQRFYTFNSLPSLILNNHSSLSALRRTSVEWVHVLMSRMKERRNMLSVHGAARYNFVSSRSFTFRKDLRKDFRDEESFTNQCVTDHHHIRYHSDVFLSRRYAFTVCLCNKNSSWVSVSVRMIVLLKSVPAMKMSIKRAFMIEKNCFHSWFLILKWISRDVLQSKDNAHSLFQIWMDIKRTSYDWDVTRLEIVSVLKMTFTRAGRMKKKYFHTLSLWWLGAKRVFKIGRTCFHRLCLSVLRMGIGPNFKTEKKCLTQYNSEFNLTIKDVFEIEDSCVISLSLYWRSVSGELSVSSAHDFTEDFSFGNDYDPSFQTRDVILFPVHFCIDNDCH